MIPRYNSYNNMKPFPYMSPNYYMNSKPLVHKIDEKKQNYNSKNVAGHHQNCNLQNVYKEKENYKDDFYNYEQYFEIFGFKLYFDDLLILALLFFLYKEDVKDNYLYIVLFILLFT